MMKFGSLRLSGIFFAVSGLLHLFATFFTGAGIPTLIIGCVWLALGVLLYRDMKWLAWPVFLLAIFGISGAIVGIFQTGSVFFWLVLVFDILTAASLFVNIWRR